MATLKDISRKTGLTISTVSDILNERPGSRYSASSRRKVREAADALGYDRNRLVHGMISGKSDLVGILVPDLANPFYFGLVQAASKALRKAGYGFLVEESGSPSDPGPEDRILRQFSEFRVDAVIACLIHPGAHLDMLKRLGGRGTAVCGLGLTEFAEGPPCDRFGIEMDAGIRAACEQLVQAGRKRFVFLGNFPWDNRLGKRWETLCSSLSELGPKGQPSANIACEHSLAGAREAFADYLARRDRGDWPDTVFALNDNLAIGVCRAAADAGLRIPEDIAVVGFDNTVLGSCQVPALSTIGIDLDELGQTMGERLLLRLRSGKRHNTFQVYESQYIPRETTPA